SSQSHKGLDLLQVDLNQTIYSTFDDLRTSQPQVFRFFYDLCSRFLSLFQHLSHHHITSQRSIVIQRHHSLVKSHMTFVDMYLMLFPDLCKSLLVRPPASDAPPGIFIDQSAKLSPAVRISGQRFAVQAVYIDQDSRNTV